MTSKVRRPRSPLQEELAVFIRDHPLWEEALLPPREEQGSAGNYLRSKISQDIMQKIMLQWRKLHPLKNSPKTP